MFHLKDASLSAFKEEYSVRGKNLERVYGVTALPGDTALREGIDEVDPEDLQFLFKPQLDFLKTQGVLQERHVLGDYTAISIDGTGYYCSGTKGCPQLMVKNHRNGKKTYYHQLLGAVAVHPNQSAVFPVACEAIVTQVARSRWKIKNETFNTLKNQGYHLEHSYGHGKKNLATNFTILTFLAFLVDQIAQHLDKDFQAAKVVCKTFKFLWEKVRSVFYLLPTMSMNAIYRFIIKRRQARILALE